MERVWSSRLRWKLRGAWLAPLVTALVVAEGALLTRLPISGEGPDLVGALLLAAFLNLLLVAAIAPLLGFVLRTARPDLPAFVARDRVGVVLVLLLAAGLLSAGLLHRGDRNAEHAAAREALTRGRAWIGAQQEAGPFARAHTGYADVYAIEPGAVYRVCVPLTSEYRAAYCAAVDVEQPWPAGIRYAGAETNQHLAAGMR
ncbi:hypothetical protein Q5424_20470 [Conexibacter sp. JD483]|uniref:hypothetical protein n=1 Tax=unclassified Conexibacter TaxID=2627773 RepID=UPI0027182B3F|nr:MULTISPECIES: hypothetical protein [unclassified Conexibacter]MDO8186992.1 hypothetical protein [Conexibacter sp. CPCC 205706]MDO8200690.1 hypothetical protein [Conexibacter sp. CPCC 205762]MDR9371485.1 hypothetical protein [Conexibacter sp. JD483]